MGTLRDMINALPGRFSFRHRTRNTFKLSFRRKKNKKKNNEAYEQTEPELLSYSVLTDEELTAEIIELKTLSDELGARSKDGYGPVFNIATKEIEKRLTPQIVALMLEKFFAPSFRLPSGINNPSKECFAIATMQALIACPPFIDFVKNGLSYLGNEKPSDRFLKIHHAVRSLVAKIQAGWSLIYCTELLDLLGFARKTEECAESFYRALYDAYLYKAFASPKEIKHWKCLHCGHVKVMEDNHARLQLAPIKGKDATTNIKMMVQYKRGQEKLELRCTQCDQMRVGTLFTTCVLSNIMMISADLLRKTTLFADFEDTVDMRYLEETPGTSEWIRGGVVHFEVTRLTKGHYVAAINKGRQLYLMNDGKSGSLVRDLKVVSDGHGDPRFAIYWRKNWETWNNGAGLNEGFEDASE
ncbi:Protein CBG15971 [Caenorhabditis briggsae]|uniref:Protein CBG15971 n=1 Tax=Caenorhabditis briggsae TaxID=6238 RepID=A8XND7_CAEBR|nr:Protein CBG15971 [Caenorhabditis briggsae]CAP34368.2 Protein CBG15971 [Caenorhabditis briggsae]